MNNIVCIGAGQTGRGYINRFFQKEKIIFIDKDKELVSKLNKNKKYTIYFGKVRNPILLNNYIAYDLETNEAKEAIQNANLIMISVGQKNLKNVEIFLLSTLLNNHNPSVDILICENGVDIADDLKRITILPNIHLAETIIFCTTVQQDNGLDIYSQDLDYLPYDIISLGHEISFQNIIPCKNLDVLMRRKIYTYNCISAVIAYIGYYKNYIIYSDAANDIDIKHCVQNIICVLNDCICKEYGTNPKEQLEFSEIAIQKFQNKDIVDTIERNVRDVDRKLRTKERIVAPLLLIQKYNYCSNDLLLVAACAIYYGKKTHTLVKSEDEYFVKLNRNWQNKIHQFEKELDFGKRICSIL